MSSVKFRNLNLKVRYKLIIVPCAGLLARFCGLQRRFFIMIMKKTYHNLDNGQKPEGDTENTVTTSTVLLYYSRSSETVL